MFIAMMGVVNKCLTLISQKECEQYKTGSLNLDEVHFDFNGEEWANLTKVAVFVAENGKVYDVPLVDNTCVVPYEVYKSTQLSVKNSSSVSNVAIGVYGITIDNGTIVKILPTNLVTLPLRLGSYFPGESPSPLPDVDQWQIYIQQIEDLANSASSSAQNASISEQEAINAAQNATKSKEDAETAANKAESLVGQLNSLEFYLNPQTGDLSYSMD